jgi:hypothetical protein
MGIGAKWRTCSIRSIIGAAIPFHLSLHLCVSFKGEVELVASNIQIDRSAIGGCLESFLVYVADVSEVRII